MARAAAHVNSRQGEAEGAPEIGIGMLLRDANFAYNRVLRARLTALDTTFSEFQHLWQLWERDGISQVELAERIGITKAASTSVLDTLERRAYIRRIRDGNDRRRTLVFLTPSGRSARKALSDCARDANAIAREGLQASEIKLVFDIVSRISANLKAARTV
jgi:DNA-binding MarR family transcriptional regulator